MTNAYEIVDHSFDVVVLGAVGDDGQVLGAVGVSGGKPEQDLECAQAGLSEG